MCNFKVSIIFKFIRIKKCKIKSYAVIQEIWNMKIALLRSGIRKKSKKPIYFFLQDCDENLNNIN
jgi:hypothetical protein